MIFRKMNSLECYKNSNIELSIKTTKKIPPWLDRTIPQLGQRGEVKEEEKKKYIYLYRFFFNVSDTVLSIMCLFVCITNIECYDY